MLMKNSAYSDHSDFHFVIKKLIVSKLPEINSRIAKIYAHNCIHTMCKWR